MKVELICVVTIVALVGCQSAPTSVSTCPEYTLPAYQSWICEGNAACIAKFPVYTTLTWAATEGSALWESQYWTWNVNNNPSIHIQCAQDYYPYPPRYQICVQYHPEDPSFTLPLAKLFACSANSWMNKCKEGQLVWSSELGTSIPCCQRPGPAVAW